jgi:hypothetical protein
MGDREQLRRKLDLAAAQEELNDLQSPDQLLKLFANPMLLGALPDTVSSNLITSYIEANLAGGEQLINFTKQVTAKIPDSVFDRSLVTGKDVTLGDLIDLSRYAIEVKKWSFGRKRNHDENLPLGV